MHWDRPAHILSLLCKHDNANWHYCTNQATHTKSKTVVCNKLQPSSQSPYAPHPRSLDLYWKNKEPGGSMAGLPQPLARAGCPSLWQPRGTGLLGAQGEGVEGGNGVTIHFSGKASACRSTVSCLQQETQPWNVLTHCSVVPCKLAVLFRSSENTPSLPCKWRAIAISFLYPEIKRKPKVLRVTRRHYILHSLFLFAKFGLEAENTLFSIN